MVYTLPAEVYSTRDAFPRAEPEMNLLFLSTYYPVHTVKTLAAGNFTRLFSLH
jgi:hypothetical protein